MTFSQDISKIRFNMLSRELFHLRLIFFFLAVNVRNGWMNYTGVVSTAGSTCTSDGFYLLWTTLSVLSAITLYVTVIAYLCVANHHDKLYHYQMHKGKRIEYVLVNHT